MVLQLQSYQVSLTFSFRRVEQHVCLLCRKESANYANGRQYFSDSIHEASRNLKSNEKSPQVFAD